LPPHRALVMHTKTVRDLVDGYLNERLSRRTFAKRMAGWGFSVTAVASILDSLEPVVRGSSAAEAAAPAASRIVSGTGGLLLVEQLHAAGVRFVFNCNGSGSRPIFDALVDRSDMQVIAVPQEGQMVAVAQGYALASGKVAFTMSDSAGFPNTLNNLYNAWHDRTPLVVGSQREPTTVDGGRDAMQEWDDFLGPSTSFTRWRWSLDRADRIPEITRRAFKIASTPPAGPVTLAFPEDVLATGDVTAAIVDHDRFLRKPAVKASPKLLEEAAQLLVEAKHPVMLVGPEVTQSDGKLEAIALAERLSISVAQGERLFDDFPTNHLLFFGDYRGPAGHGEDVDLVVSLGSRIPHQDQMMPEGAKVVHISSDPDSIGKVVPTDLGIVADVKEAAVDLLAAIGAVATKATLDRIRDERLATVRASTDRVRAERTRIVKEGWDRSPLSRERVSAELIAVLDKDAIIVPELAQYAGERFKENVALSQFTFTPGGMSRIGRTTGGALGWGVGAAVGVKLARPDRQVVTLQGDGGFLFAQAETLWTMARYEVPVLIVIYNNRSYDGPRDQIFRHGGRQAETGKDMTCYLGNPDIDFAKVAAGFGVKGEVVETPDQLTAALQRGIRETREGRPYLIDAITARVGMGADSTWYPKYSVAASTTRKPGA
jgi:benzoylformate decarboxylase